MGVSYKKVVVAKKPANSSFDNPFYRTTTETEDELEHGEIAEEKLNDIQ